MKGKSMMWLELVSMTKDQDSHPKLPCPNCSFVIEKFVFPIDVKLASMCFLSHFLAFKLITSIAVLLMGIEFKVPISMGQNPMSLSYGAAKTEVRSFRFELRGVGH